jgi:hypothetical protein
MSRLPQPDWDRPGETWRVEPEDAVPWRTDVRGLICRYDIYRSHRPRCRRRAVAGYSTRDSEFHPLCEQHLNAGKMWIEDGHVVSWRLSK